MKIPTMAFLTDGGTMHCAFEPPLTDAMCAELRELLSSPLTLEDALAVLKGISEDWNLTIRTKCEFGPWKWN